MTGFFRFVLVVLLLTVVAMTSAIVTMHFAIHGTEVSVPDFRGMSAADAGQRAAAMGLTVHLENRLYSTEVPEGRISNQSPVAGAIVRRGWRVWLTESLGPQKLAIPNVTGKDQRLATVDIRRADMQTGVIAAMPWPDAPGGTVIAQNPQADATGVESPVMNLLVASSDTTQPPANQLVMPEVTGEVFTAAALSLVHMGLHLAPVQEQDMHVAGTGSPSQGNPPVIISPGTVVAQNPAAGFRVDPSMAIQLTVAK
ncbi:MAG: PASTA domain-containing protein [Acidobacteriaceae bacterium]